jgi:hypothetical protein
MHVNKLTSTEASIPSSYPSGYAMLGEHLNHIFGKNYFAISITSAQIKYRCSKRYFYCHSEDEEELNFTKIYKEQLLEYHLNKMTDKPLFIKTNSDTIHSLVKIKSPQICHGAGNCQKPNDHFDALLFLPKADSIEFYR